MKENWKNIQGYSDKYQISSFGRVKSHKYKISRILKLRKNKRCSIRFLSRKYRVSRCVIDKIVKRINWKDCV